MSLSIYRIILVCLFIFALSAKAEEKFTFNVVKNYQQNMADLVDVPGKPDVKAVQVKGEVGRYGWCTIDLGRTFAAGQYNLEFTVSALKENAATVSLYSEMKGGQSQITGPLTCAAGQSNAVKTFFYSPIAFNGLAIKKMVDSKNPGTAISQITITDLHQKEFPRPAGYHSIMNHAAPWGLRSEIIEGKPPEEMEPWLDLRSGAAEVFGRADYLLRVVRLKKIGDLNSQAKSLEEGLEGLQKAVDQNRQKEIPKLITASEKQLNELQQSLEKSLGGIVCPELGTDIFTWLKAWRLRGATGDGEYSEPTPYRAVYDEAQFYLTKPEGKMDLSSTWTSSIYYGEKMTVIYTMLTPFTVVEVKDGKFKVEIKELKVDQIVIPQSWGVTSRDREGAGILLPPKTEGLHQIIGSNVKDSKSFDGVELSGWFALSSARGGVLFVVNRKIKQASWMGKELTLDFGQPAAVGFVTFKPALKPRLAQTAGLYREILVNQPVECVQIQKGNHIEQVFEYIKRPCDWPVKTVTVAPVPDFVLLALKPSSKLKVKMDLPIRKTASGFGYIAEREDLAYEISANHRVGTFGVNLIDSNSSLAQYKEFHDQGCKTIRLACGGFTPWDWKQADKLKRTVRRNLQWAKEVGELKVGVDAHGWLPPGKYEEPEMLKEFIRRWKEIISWCKGYEDVVGWYDLINEPNICYEHESVKPYAVFMRKALKALRPDAGKTPFLVEAVNGGNPIGLDFWEDLGDSNIIVGYHDYWPHMFTHQWVLERDNSTFCRVYYPSFMPMVEWSVPMWRNDNPGWYYWDRWKCDSISLGVYRLMIEKGLRMDCGEYGVVGYAGQSAVRSGVIWMRHILERLNHLGINHDMWSPADSTGFTWLVPEFKEETIRFWKKASELNK